jgi:N-acetylmuramoyl-L-alanine amidase
VNAKPAGNESARLGWRRRLGLRALGGALCALLVGATALIWVVPSAQAANPARSVSRPSAEPATLKLRGVRYVEARAWFARLGYKATMDAKGEEMTLSSAAGRVILGKDSREIRVHGARVFLGESVEAARGSFYVSAIDLERFLGPMLRPQALFRRPLQTIVIDAGHGGNDSGTQNIGLKLNEKTFTLDVARRLQRLLVAEGYRVVMTRTDDRFIALPARAEIANDAKADLFVSIHFNAVPNNGSVRGTETYVLTPQYQRSTSSAATSPEDRVAQPGNRHDGWSAVLGWQMHRQILAKLKSEDRGYKRARFAVLRLVNCPGVLVEAGYLSNDAEARRIATPEYRADLAEALAAAIEGYAKSLKTTKK